jgi:nucleoside-diphosphate-sugar epimerase
MRFKKAFFKIVLNLVAAFIVAIAVLAVLPRGGDPMPPAAQNLDTTRHQTVAVFGATGSVGDGLLKAAVNDPEISQIYIVTRRTAPRIEEAVASGKAEMVTHMDYLDYVPLREMLAEVDTVFWAIGITARAVSKEQYGVIHVDFPVALLTEWLDAGKDDDLSFHYISGQGAKADSSWHWAREKARAERALFDLAESADTRVISYRPGAVIHSIERAGFGDKVIQFVFEPFKLSVRSTVIGRAMLEVSARGDELPHGTILENRDIRRYGAGYSERVARP